jgi:hypothetical protein
MAYSSTKSESHTINTIFFLFTCSMTAINGSVSVGVTVATLADKMYL